MLMPAEMIPRLLSLRTRYHVGASEVLMLFSGSKKTKSGESTPDISVVILLSALTQAGRKSETSEIHCEDS